MLIDIVYNFEGLVIILSIYPCIIQDIFSSIGNSNHFRTSVNNSNGSNNVITSRTGISSPFYFYKLNLSEFTSTNPTVKYFISSISSL